MTSVVSDSATPWTGASQAPLSMGFSRQEYWSGLPRLPPGQWHYQFHIRSRWNSRSTNKQKPKSSKWGQNEKHDESLWKREKYKRWVLKNKEIWHGDRDFRCSGSIRCHSSARQWWNCEYSEELGRSVKLQKETQLWTALEFMLSLILSSE